MPQRTLYAEDNKARKESEGEPDAGRNAYTVALLESVRFNSARDNRNLTNSSVSCSLKSAHTFCFGARKKALDICGVGGGVSPLKDGSEMKSRNDKRTRPVDTITQDFFERVMAAM
jgi:hypothetical protein